MKALTLITCAITLVGTLTCIAFAVKESDEPSYFFLQMFTSICQAGCFINLLKSYLKESK